MRLKFFLEKAETSSGLAFQYTHAALGKKEKKRVYCVAPTTLHTTRLHVLTAAAVKK